MATDSQSPQPHTCQYCDRIVLDKPVKEEQYGLYEVTLPHTRGDVYEAVEAGCPFFALYPKLPFYNLGLSESLAPGSWKPWFSPIPYLKFPGWERRHLWTLGKSMFNPFDRPYEVVYNTEGDLDLRCTSWSSAPDSFRIVASSDDPAAADIPFRPMNPRVNSDEVFEFLRSQIRECHETHVSQGVCPAPTTGFSPRRVIRIEAHGESVSVRLYAPEKDEQVRWCALSYCWGGDQLVKTTVATLQERYRGIDMELLPQTILDAITTASRLGLEYIWIDSLCIVQDDEGEKLVDIAQMADIYSQADFTISASSAAAVAEGFLQDHVVPQPKMPISLRYLSQAGVEGRITLCAEPTPFDIPDPINSRAWTFQERVLSPRLVEFSSTQVRWRCNSVRKCQAGCPPESTWKWFFTTPQIVTANALSRMDAFEAFAEWNVLVRAYSDRSLSYPPDKLIAFSAVAQSVGRQGRYLAGLWESDFPCNLLWKIHHIWTPSGGDDDKRHPRPPGYRASSWSWASVDGEVTCQTTSLSSPKPDPACEVVECQVELANEALPFGAVKSGHIIISGRMRAAVFFPLTGEMHFYDSAAVESGEQGLATWYKGFADVKSEEDETLGSGPSCSVWCLHIRSIAGRGEGLLLVEDEEVFCRIGHFYWSEEDVGLEFQHSEPRTVKIV